MILHACLGEPRAFFTGMLGLLWQPSHRFIDCTCPRHVKSFNLILDAKSLGIIHLLLLLNYWSLGTMIVDKLSLMSLPWLWWRKGLVLGHAASVFLSFCKVLSLGCCASKLFTCCLGDILAPRWWLSFQTAMILETSHLAS